MKPYGNSFFWQNSQNCILNLHGITLREIISFEQMVSDSISKTEQKKISLLAKEFRQACQNCILRVQRKSLRRRKAVFWKFWDLSENFAASGKKVAGQVVKTVIYVPKGTSSIDFDSDKNLSVFSSLDIELKELAFFQNCCGINV